jgi:ferrochelatase
LLPLYPQFSTTTTGSSFDDWDRAAALVGLSAPTSRVCCYSAEAGFVAGLAEHIRATMASRKPGLAYRLLLSAHGLPKRIVEGGDPYQWQVERTAAALVDALGIKAGGDIDHRVCYQSRVGPLKWLEPATDAEIRRAGAEGCGVIVAPIAFVSEHSETLVELDIEYAKLAQAARVPDYRRVPTVGASAAFINGLAGLAVKAVNGGGTVNDGSGRLCPANFRCCALETV